MGKTSAAVKNRYNAKAYDRVGLVLPKGYKDTLKDHADRFDGGSVNALIKRAIEAQIVHDLQKGEE